jgi:hypothetical protein
MSVLPDDTPVGGEDTLGKRGAIMGTESAGRMDLVAYL